MRILFLCFWNCGTNYFCAEGKRNCGTDSETCWTRCYGKRPGRLSQDRCSLICYLQCSVQLLMKPDLHATLCVYVVTATLSGSEVLHSNIGREYRGSLLAGKPGERTTMCPSSNNFAARLAAIAWFPSCVFPCKFFVWLRISYLLSGRMAKLLLSQHASCLPLSWRAARLTLHATQQGLFDSRLPARQPRPSQC